MKGIVYGVGVGPGDPELITRKAVRLISEADIIAVTGKKAEDAVAYRIAAAAVPQIAEKEVIGISMPMIRDRAKIEEAHREAADMIKRFLDQGKTVVYLILGDPAVYSTFGYLHRILQSEGYNTEIVPAVTSFCAAAAKLGILLAEWDEPLYVIPAVHSKQQRLEPDGTYVFMKSGRRMTDIKDLLRQSGREAQAVENCGMDDEKLYRSIEEIPDDSGYYTLIIAK